MSGWLLKAKLSACEEVDTQMDLRTKLPKRPESRRAYEVNANIPIVLEIASRASLQ